MKKLHPLLAIIRERYPSRVYREAMKVARGYFADEADVLARAARYVRFVDRSKLPLDLVVKLAGQSVAWAARASEERAP